MTSSESGLGIRSRASDAGDARQIEHHTANALSSSSHETSAEAAVVRAGPFIKEDASTLRMLAVWTRDLDSPERVGRVNVARKVREAFHDMAEVSNRRLTNAFEEPSRVKSLLLAITSIIGGLLSGRPLPLQCALFAAAARRTGIVTEGLAADVVYLDGIRTLLLMRRLRRAAPRLRIVVDLDDLMSRRYEHLGACGMALPLGYLERMVPQFLLRLALGKNVARIIFWYESRALRNAESEVLRLADSIVLLNGNEAEILRKVAAVSTPVPRATVVAIPPMASRISCGMTSGLQANSTVWRAIFVGSDTLVQNRLTIAYLMDLWSTFEIKTPLFIFGRQKTRWAPVPNVTFCGYIENIADAYRPGSILVYPCFLPGGIKTKVLEAFAHGVPVVGNAATFEAILPANYPLVISDKAALVTLLKDPAARAQDLACAVSVASAYLEQEHSANSFVSRWREAVLGTSGNGQ
jgi:hypothetical protein